MCSLKKNNKKQLKLCTNILNIFIYLMYVHIIIFIYFSLYAFYLSSVCGIIIKDALKDSGFHLFSLIFYALYTLLTIWCAFGNTYIKVKSFFFIVSRRKGEFSRKNVRPFLYLHFFNFDGKACIYNIINVESTSVKYEIIQIRDNWYDCTIIISSLNFIRALNIY